MAVLRGDGKLGARGNFREGGDVSARHGSHRPAPEFWTRHRALLRKNHQRAYSPGDRVLHGRIHGKETGPPRHDRRDAGAAAAVTLLRLAPSRARTRITAVPTPHLKRSPYK